MKVYKQIYSFIVFIGFFAIVPNQNVFSQSQTISMREAVDRALTTHPEMKIQEFAIENAIGMHKNASLVPNPVFSYYREDLGLNGKIDGESILSAGFPLKFLWTRSASITEAEESISEAEFIRNDKMRQITFAVQKAYLDYHYANLSLDAWQNAAAIVQKALDITNDRLAEGDVAGYDQHRIALEYLMYAQAEDKSRMELENRQFRLAFLIGLSKKDPNIETVDDFPRQLTVTTVENIISQAMENRPDLKAAKAQLRVKQASFNIAKKNVYPDIILNAGYKKQVDNTKGSIIQLTVGIPIFNRNQGIIQSANAQLEQQQPKIEYMEKQISLEIEQAYNRYIHIRNIIDQFSLNTYQVPERVLEIAQTSYSEGEMTLIELLDAVRAFNEVTQMRLELFFKYQLSMFELENVSASSVTSF